MTVVFARSKKVSPPRSKKTSVTRDTSHVGFRPGHFQLLGRTRAARVKLRVFADALARSCHCRERLLFLFFLLIPIDALAGADLKQGYEQPTLNIRFETADMAEQTPYTQSQPNDQPKAQKVDEEDKAFTDNFDVGRIALYYGTKYQRDTDYLLSIIHHTIAAAKENNVSPFILLAIISHESNFSHTARSNSGAEGLMQIMSAVHKKRFERFGGIRMTYVPEVNIRVGATILHDCIAIMKSVSGGLRCYSGSIYEDSAFTNFVLSEATKIKRIAAKRSPQS